MNIFLRRMASHNLLQSKNFFNTPWRCKDWWWLWKKGETCRLIDCVCGVVCECTQLLILLCSQLFFFFNLFRFIQFYSNNVCPSHQNAISDKVTCRNFVLYYVKSIRRRYRAQGHVTLLMIGWPAGVWNAK
jgi:hypothetical protein